MNTALQPDIGSDLCPGEMFVGQSQGAAVLGKGWGLSWGHREALESRVGISLSLSAIVGRTW